MLKQLFEYVQGLLLLSHETQWNRDDIEDLQRRMEDLTEKVRVLASDLQRVSEREQHEREKFVLKVENALLRFERQLAAGKESRKSK